MLVWCSGFSLKTRRQSPDVTDRIAHLAARLLANREFAIEVLAENTPWLLLRIKDAALSVGEGFETARVFGKDPDIIIVEPILQHDGLYPDEIEPPPGVIPTPSASEMEWPLDQIRGKEAWETAGNKGDGIRLAQLDTGYTEHPELFTNTNLRKDLGYNFEEGCRDPKEPLETIQKGHGTATGSVLFSLEGPQMDPSGKEFVSGIVPNSELVPIRVDKDVYYYWSAEKDALGVYHALKNNCDIVTMSRGGTVKEVLKDAVDTAVNEGVIIVAAAGNCKPWCFVVYPASHPSVIAVAGSTKERRPWEESSHGPKVDIGAPAHLVYRARARREGDSYAYDIQPSSGTSYATPLTAGAAALWLAKHGGRKVLQEKYGRSDAPSLVFRYVLKTKGFSEGIDWDTRRFGPGILDANALVSADLPSLEELQSFEEAILEVSFEKITDTHRRALDHLFAGKVAHLDDVYEEVGDELFFHIHFMPNVHLAFEALLKEPQPPAVFSDNLSTFKNTLLEQSISPTLRKYLEGD